MESRLAPSTHSRSVFERRGLRLEGFRSSADQRLWNSVIGSRRGIVRGGLRRRLERLRIDKREVKRRLVAIERSTEIICVLPQKLLFFFRGWTWIGSTLQIASLPAFHYPTLSHYERQSRSGNLVLTMRSLNPPARHNSTTFQERRSAIPLAIFAVA
ncbi:hypothetical protein KC329_g80 [Hortaea werneckii]|nr:hypothetical protein KC329_g80 [Hortaea werneckii]